MAHATRQGIGPILFHKIRLNKEQRSPVLYGWHHNAPWSKFNNFAYFWSEQRPIRKTVVNHAQRVKQIRAFGDRFNATPTVMQELSQSGPFTLFCPTNQAMDMILESAWDKLWEEERARFLRHHAVKGRWGIEELVAAAAGETMLSFFATSPAATGARISQPQMMPRKPLMSMADQPLPIQVSGSLEEMNRVVRIAGAAVKKANIRCWNGYVHLIDRPLVPRWR